MSHPQRVQAATDHPEPDYVPLHSGTGGRSAPVPKVYARPLAMHSLQSELRLVPQMRLAIADEENLNVDFDIQLVSMRPARKGRRPCD